MNHPESNPVHTFLDSAREQFLTDPRRATYRALGPDDPAAPLGIGVQHLPDGDLDTSARALAVRLRTRARVGDRALILCEPGLGYITAFFACLYAGVVAVPAYPPVGATAHRLGRIEAVSRDCAASVMIVDDATDAEMAAHADSGAAALPRFSVAAIDTADASSWRRPPIVGADLAFLQYSSGSTGTPKGVMVTHRNLLAQTAVVNDRFLNGVDEAWETFTWLPPYHDMGLIGSLLTFAVSRSSATLMTPMAFLKRPLRWLEAVTAIRARLTGAPNFALDLCVRKATPEAIARLDLSSLDVLFSGAEPVRADTLERFAETFGPAGFDPAALLPCYGLAEGTLAVTAKPRPGPSRTLTASRAGLLAGESRAPECAEDERRLVSCGRAMEGHTVRIVDPAEGAELAPGLVGEIQVAGPSVTDGYFGQPELTAETFLPDADGTVWLRTGDLGYLDAGELVVVGRRKDLLIVNGRNHHPHDLEDAIVASHPGVRPGGVAAFALEESEDVGLVVEVEGRITDEDASAIDRGIREVLGGEHGVAPAELVLVRPGTVPKTSSGKVQRSACRAALSQGLLDGRIRWRFGGRSPRPELAGAVRS